MATNLLKDLSDGFVLYHGCGIFFRDGMNILITKRKTCKRSTSKCFWKDAVYVNNRVKTRSQISKQTVWVKKF